MNNDDIAPVIMAEHVATLDNLHSLINRQTEAARKAKEHLDVLLTDLHYIVTDGLVDPDNAENVLNQLMEIKRRVESERQAKAQKPKETT